MSEDKIYSSVLDYMCKNYDYSLYATDFDSHKALLLQRAIASLPSLGGKNRIIAIKFALQDFFNAIFQQVFVYEDEERLKIVKYFDKEALNEEQDRQIHALRLELLSFKSEVSSTINKNAIYMFGDNFRKKFESSLLFFQKKMMKTILREQISFVFDLDKRDVVVFLSGKIFIKKFKYTQNEEDRQEESAVFLEDKRFVESLWVEISRKLEDSFSGSFEFINFDEMYFFKNYPKRFFSTVKSVVKQSFDSSTEDTCNQYINVAFKNYLPLMLESAAIFLLDKVLQDDLRAIKFLKYHSSGARFVNNNMKLDRAPLIDSTGKIYMYQNILGLLNKKEQLNTKLTHKNIEIKSIKEKVKRALHVRRKSEDEMEAIQKRRFELLIAIEKAEHEISELTSKSLVSGIDINRLEFSKRDLLEAFKQVEVRLKTQINILNNANKELNKWENQQNEKIILKEGVNLDYEALKKEYKVICSVLAVSLSKEPVKI